jgi:HAD superfamily hydrolase (TIGR01549 family)
MCATHSSWTGGLTGVQSVRAVIFDIDGTLLDSVDLHAHSWVESFARLGIDAEFEEVRRHIGEGADRLMAAFAPKEMTEAEKKRIEDFRAQLFAKKYLRKVRPFPKVRALFERLRSARLQLVLGSSCTSDEITKYKEIAGIANLIDCETTSDDAPSSKPAPDIFLKALERLAPLEAAECVVIGDSVYDGEAARKAGLAFIGVLCGSSSKQELRAAGAVAIYRDPEDLLARWAGRDLAGERLEEKVPVQVSQ